MQEETRGKRYLTTPNGTFVLDEQKTRFAFHEKKKKKALFKTPKHQLIAILAAMMGIATVGTGDIKGIVNTVLAVLISSAIDLYFNYKQNQTWKVPDGAILSGMIIGMVISSAAPWYQTAAAALAAILSKHFLKVKKKPIFNPAAFGLWFAAVVFSSGQSWWGGLPLLPSWCIAFLFIGGYLMIKKVNKFAQVFAFLGTYLTIFLILAIIHYGDVADILRNPYIQSALFLAFFMVTDPPTSPAKEKDQILFGMIAAVVSIADYLIFGGISFLLVGLLAANGWKAWKFRKRKTAQS